MWTLEIERERVMRALLDDNWYTAYVLARAEGVDIQDLDTPTLSEVFGLMEDQGLERLDDLGIYEDDVNTELDILLNKMSIEITALSLKYVPVDTGKLKKSLVYKKVDNGFMIGFNCDYAMWVHEVAYRHHKKPTRYKYLEDASIEVISKYRKQFGSLMADIRIEYSYGKDGVYVIIGRGIDTGKKDLEDLVDFYTSDKKDAYVKMARALYHGKNKDKNIALYNKLIDYVDYHQHQGAKNKSLKNILESFIKRDEAGTLIR